MKGKAKLNLDVTGDVTAKQRRPTNGCPMASLCLTLFRLRISSQHNQLPNAPNKWDAKKEQCLKPFEVTVFHILKVSGLCDGLNLIKQLATTACVSICRYLWHVRLLDGC